jgi:hypothetical protein
MYRLGRFIHGPIALNVDVSYTRLPPPQARCRSLVFREAFSIGIIAIPLGTAVAHLFPLIRTKMAKMNSTSGPVVATLVSAVETSVPAAAAATSWLEG